MSLCIWGLYLVITSYPTKVGIVLYALIIATFFAILAGYVDGLVLRYISGRNDDEYIKWLDDTMPLRYLANWVICGWIGTAVAINKRTQEVKQKFQLQSDAAVLLKEAELYKLRQQLQPHFLYNSLNSISALTMIEPGKAQDMISKLSEFLRTSVKRESQDKIPLSDELLYIESYLAIESVRFGDRLRVRFEHEDNVQAIMPPFLLQPILENAIKFGLYGVTGEVTICVQIKMIDDMLRVIINNPFDAAAQMPRGTGFGLEGIRRRLYLLYARTDLLETTIENERYTTTLKIPQ